MRSLFLMWSFLIVFISGETEKFKHDLVVGNVKTRCEFNMIFTGTKIDVKKSKVLCSKIKKDLRVSAYKITSETSGNIYTITMVVKRKGGKGIIKQATLELAPVVEECSIGYYQVCSTSGDGSCPSHLSLVCPTSPGHPVNATSTPSCSCLQTVVVEQMVAKGASPFGSCYKGCACVSPELLECTAPATLGILIAGGNDHHAPTVNDVELFIPSTGTSKTCSTMSLTDGKSHPTLNTDDNKPVICNFRTCQVFSGGKWSDYSNPLKIRRRFGESWFSKEGLILIGGYFGMTTTEKIPIGGGMSEWGFNLKYNVSMACLIIDADSFLLTGGANTNGAFTTVQRYNLQGFVESLPNLKLLRWGHGCGSYKRSDGTLVYMVGGGNDDRGAYLDSTEILVSGGVGGWVAGTPLPGPRFEPAFVSMNNRLFVTGGHGGHGSHERQEVLELVDEEWKDIGQIQKGRYRHAAVGIEVTPKLLASCH